jgi:hypothetical protein
MILYPIVLQARKRIGTDHELASALKIELADGIRAE